ncbi:MAG: hypothetical protein GF393_04400, partial [Armatimonadia bacterium]|nr:hypothetical protein [Armatimonadia bacterium]
MRSARSWGSVPDMRAHWSRWGTPVLLWALTMMVTLAVIDSRQNASAEGGSAEPRRSPRDTRPHWALGTDTIVFSSTRQAEDEKGRAAIFAVDLDDPTSIRRISPRGYTLLDVRDGQALAWDSYAGHPTEQPRYYKLDVIDGRVTPLQLDSRAYDALAFGPTSDLLVFERRAQSRRTSDIYAAEIEAGNGAIRRQWCVIRDPNPATNPCWSSDGKTIAYIANPHYFGDDIENFEVRLLRLDDREETATTFETVFIADERERIASLRWLSDNRRLLLYGHPLRILDTETGEVTDYHDYLRDQGHLSDELIRSLGSPTPKLDGSDCVVASYSQRKSDDI